MVKKFINILLTLLIFFLDSIFAFLYKKINNSREYDPSILLVRIDAIGDYVLFRNFIEILKNSEQYKNYRITLVGNIIWKDLALSLDSQFINDFIFIDRRKFSRNLSYRYNKLKEISSKSFEIILNPIYSRDFFHTDTIVKLANAKYKIGSIGNLSNITVWQKKLSDKYYTKLISANDELIFEFYRNKEFFENFLGENLEIKKTYINLNFNVNIRLPQNYVILFLGASANYRKWPIKHFVEVAKYIQHTYGMNVLLAGGSTDIEDAKNFEKMYKKNVYNFVGKTSLLELLKIMYNGNLIISNETSAPHFAIALGTLKTLVISNGNHFGRFTPYPKEMTDKYYVIYHPKIESNLNNYKKLSNNYGYGSKLDISEISVKSVLKKVDDILRKVIV